VWVDANFKEVQLGRMRIGQPVTLTADAYGSSVVYHGRVIGFSAGTGSAFSLLPAQNATGNWIKVVQRLPVRIGLDPKELAQHPLRIGLSMQADVDIHDESGSELANAPTTEYQTDVFARYGDDADAEIARIIAANAGHGADHAANGGAVMNEGREGRADRASGADGAMSGVLQHPARQTVRHNIQHKARLPWLWHRLPYPR
jgi:membrane fusion protein (multidrug efflux system)